jgi:hypothetical protein
MVGSDSEEVLVDVDSEGEEVWQAQPAARAASKTKGREQQAGKDRRQAGDMLLCPVVKQRR